MELNDGKYRAKATAWTLAESGQGTPEVAVAFQFSDPDLGNKSITWHGYLSDKTYQRTVESLRICGWTGDDLSDLAGLDANEVELVVENEEYEGEVNPKVRWVNRIGGGLAVKAPMTPEKAKTFAASMRTKIRAFDAAAKAKPKAKASNGAGGEKDPFEPGADLDI